MILCYYIYVGVIMNGIIVIDKDKDYTSRDIVNITEKIFNTRKVGHAGTLDPMATGVLVLGLGTGVKILEYLNDNDKEYIATVKLGILTDTLDITGNIIEEVKDFNITREEVESTLKSFIGKYDQVVPLYSSVKVSGERLYKYARNNKEVELPSREVEIYNIELLSFNNDEFTFKTTVSKGTYIRSLIRDIGDKLNISCTMKELRRTRQGDFSLDDAITTQDLKDEKIKILPLDLALKNLLIVDVDSYIENKINHGAILRNLYDKDLIAYRNQNNEIIAIYKVYEKDNTKVKPVKVFYGK